MDLNLVYGAASSTVFKRLDIKQVQALRGIMGAVKATLTASMQVEL